MSDSCWSGPSRLSGCLKVFFLVKTVFPFFAEVGEAAGCGLPASVCWESVEHAHFIRHERAPVPTCWECMRHKKNKINNNKKNPDRYKNSKYVSSHVIKTRFPWTAEMFVPKCCWKIALCCSSCASFHIPPLPGTRPMTMREREKEREKKLAGVRS